MFIAELNHPDFARYDLSSLRTGIMAGSPCPVEVMKQVKSAMHMSDVAIAYGMTETSPVSTQTRHRHAARRSRWARWGRCTRTSRSRSSIPQTGQVVPVGRPGRAVHARLQRDARLLEQRRGDRGPPSTRARWMHTGDLATMDEEGYVNIVGRIKDMIIRGGENMYPREIEEFLYGHPKVQDVQVIGVPDAQLRRGGHGLGPPARGRRRRRPRRSATICRGKIAHYKIPRYVKFVDGFPMTVTGKVQKFLMREESVVELGLEQAAAVKMA